MMTRVKTSGEITSMRESGRMLATVHQVLEAKIGPGISTKELDTIARKELSSLGGKPAFLGIYGFPETLCVSINDEIVHGIPKANRIISDGDVVSMDFGVIYKEMITDASITVIVGKSTEQKNQLLDTTNQALLAGISILRNGVRVGDIGYAIEQTVKPMNYGIVRDLVGHGVGHKLHEEPNIPNFGNLRTGKTLKTGMTIAIEPMVALGSGQVVVDPDGWTVRTADNSLSAHFEHTVLITEKGYEILTSLPA